LVFIFDPPLLTEQADFLFVKKKVVRLRNITSPKFQFWVLAGENYRHGSISREHSDGVNHILRRRRI
jgi:hypothetical protein